MIEVKYRRCIGRECNGGCKNLRRTSGVRRMSDEGKRDRVEWD